LKQYAEYDFQKQGYGICRKHSAPVTSVAINAAAQIFVSGCRDGKVQMFDALSGQDVVALLRPIGEFGVDSLQMGMNDHLLFAGTTTGFVYCWDLRYDIESCPLC
jgi:WD40 repeat protein